MVGGDRGTFTIVCRFCKRLHFYHFTRKAANLYPTPTLCNDTAAPPTDAAMDEPPPGETERGVCCSPLTTTLLPSGVCLCRRTRPRTACVLNVDLDRSASATQFGRHQTSKHARRGGAGGGGKSALPGEWDNG